jgi:DDB1- and CUL4-associated factor 13
LDYAPTGRQFVTGSFDKTMRIFDHNGGRSVHCYHTKRMQKISSVCWSIEGGYILSGSDETNIRIWKNDPSRKIGPVGKREERVQNYRKKLVEKYKFSRKVKNLKKAHLPKYLINEKHKRQIMSESKHRKMLNMEANNGPDFYDQKGEKEKKHVKTIE